MIISNNGIRNAIIILTIVISISLFFYGKRLIDNLNHLRVSEVALFTESRLLDQNFSEFQRALGFGGYIHNIKEYLLHRSKYQLIILKANINELDSSYTYFKKYFRDSESRLALESLDNFLQVIHESYEILILPENRNLESVELDNLLKLEIPETLSALITLETFKDNYSRRATSKIKSSIDELVSNLLFASILLPLIILVGIYLTYLLNKAHKSSRELEAARRQLLDSEERLEAISRTARVGGWELEPVQSELRWTLETFNIFDIPFKRYISSEEALGFYSQDSQEIIKSKIDQAFQNGSSFQLELPYENKSGNRGFVHIIGTPITSGGKVIKLRGTVQDISERKSLEEQLQQVHKMEAIGLLAGGIAHDFNNMLSGIMNAAQLILLHDKDPESKVKKYVDMILIASTRAADLTAQLLNFGGKGVLEKKSINIQNLIDEVVAILKRTIDKNISFAVTKESEHFFVYGDHSSLQNAIMNLGINASHAMPGGGEISIHVENVLLDQEACNRSSFDLAEGEYCVIGIRDTGFGISPENLLKIFDPFFTTKDMGKGTGLGLASVYRTVLDHHGSITVTSEERSGTSFRIMLPFIEEGKEVEDPDSQIYGGSGLILLVDDEDVLRETNKSILEDMGYSVLTAENGKEAIHIYQSRHSEIKLVLLDMIMPEMRGNEVFYKMKEIDKNCRVIILSGYTKDENMDELKNSGVADFLRKPYKDYELSQTIHKILDLEIPDDNKSINFKK